MTYVPLPPDTPFTAKIGVGGVPSTSAGVDFWRAGNPPRPYKWLGFLVATSEAELQKSVGTPALAKLVRDSGGDALVVVAVADLPIQARVAISAIPGASQHQYWVVKYLPANSYAVADDDHAKQVIEVRSWTEDQCADPNSMTSMAQLTPEQRSSVREEIRKQIARISEAMRNEPEEARRRNEELQNLTMQMLDCQEQRQVAEATQAAIRGGIGTEVSWTSSSNPAVKGRSIAAAEEKLGDGTHCVTVTDVIIVDGEETISAKRLCRRAGASGYSRT